MKTRIHSCLILFVLLGFTRSAVAQGTAFSYQGRLNDGSNPANGTYDLRFTVYDSTNSPGIVIAGPVTNSATSVSNGLFTVTLDFGMGVFTGPSLWLQIDVETNGGSAFTTLLPRQAILPVPYAITANSAGNLLGTLPTTQLSGSIQATNISGTVPLAQLPSAVLTNNETGVNLNGTFGGDGWGLSNFNTGQLPQLVLTNESRPVSLLSPGNNIVGTFGGSGWGLSNFNAGQLPQFVLTNEPRPVSLLNPLNNMVGAFGGTAWGLSNFNAGQLPQLVLTNDFRPVSLMNSGNNFSGTFSGSGAGLTNVAFANAGDYVFSYSTTTQAVVTANTFQDITNNVDAQIRGFTHAANSASFFVNQSGLYLIHYDAEVTITTMADSMVSLRAVVNGTEVAGSQCAASATTASVVVPTSKSFIAYLSLFETLKFQLTGTSTADCLISNTGGGAARPSFSCTILRFL